MYRIDVGCAFVTYANRQCAQNAIKAMHHSQTMEVNIPNHCIKQSIQCCLRLGCNKLSRARCHIVGLPCSASREAGRHAEGEGGEKDATAPSGLWHDVQLWPWEPWSTVSGRKC